jgi:hypothetical protein
VFIASDGDYESNSDFMAQSEVHCDIAINVRRVGVGF